MRTGSTTDRATAALLAALALALGVAIGALFGGLEEWAPEPHRALLGSLRLVAIAAALFVLGDAARRRREIFGRPIAPIAAPIGLAARGAGYAVLLAIAFATIAQAATGGGRSFASSGFSSALLLLLAAWVGATLRAPTRVFAKPTGGLRAADALLGTAALLLLVAEGCLTLYESLDPSPFTLKEALGGRRVEAFRLPPGYEWRGLRFNSRGYHDEEFFVAEEEDLVVALLGNSFATGIVPSEFNVGTIAERALADVVAEQHRRVAIHNFGVPSISMAEYAWLVRHEVMEMRPTLVVLLVAFGSDIHSLVWKHRFYSLQYFRLGAVVRRLRLAAEESAEMEAIRHRIRTTLDPRWDPTESTPTFDEEDHLTIEVSRLPYTRPGNRAMTRQFERFYAALDGLQRLLGDKLRVVLVPEEFQVDDDVWARSLARVPDPEAYVRDLPQQRIASHCRERGIPVLDLLTPLARAQREGAVHHPRDTHWNTRGNRIAGEAIARFIADTLPGERTGLARASDSR